MRAVNSPRDRKNPTGLSRIKLQTSARAKIDRFWTALCGLPKLSRGQPLTSPIIFAAERGTTMIWPKMNHVHTVDCQVQHRKCGRVGGFCCSQVLLAKRFRVQACCHRPSAHDPATGARVPPPLPLSGLSPRWQDVSANARCCPRYAARQRALPATLQPCANAYRCRHARFRPLFSAPRNTTVRSCGRPSVETVASVG